MNDIHETQRLLQELDFYKSLFENHPDAVLAWGAEGRYTLVNEAAKQMFGYTAQEFREDVNFRDLVAEPDRTKAISHLEKALRGEPQSYEITIVRRDGKQCFVRVTKVPMKQVDGCVPGVFNIVRDITERKHAEEKLRQSEARLARAQRVANFGSWEWDIQTDELACSEELHHIMGVELGSIDTYEKFRSCVHEEDREGVDRTSRSALEGHLLDNQFRVRRPDGELRTLHAQGEVLFDENGSPLKMIGIDRDITDQIEQERRLRERDELLRLISENAQDIISYSSPEGRVRFISPSVRRLLGYEPEEVIGQLSSDLYHPEDLERLMNTSFAFTDDGDIFTCRVRHKDGRWIWFETTVKLIRDKNGNVDMILGIGRDITARKQVEDHLRATRDQMDSYIENNADAIALLDLDWKMLRINRAYERMFGVLAEDVIGHTPQTILVVPDDCREEYRRFQKQVENGETVLGHETCRLRRDGTKLNVMLSISPVRDGDGRVVGSSVTIRDITERKRTEELLLKSEKLGIAGQLAAGVAHEIRNPLTALKGFVQLMQIGFREDKYLDVMSSELQRIENIVSELLVLAKPQVIRHRQVALGDIFKHISTLIETQAILNNVQVISKFDPDSPDLPMLTCDENQLKQVFLNFLQNAIDAMPNGGRVTLGVKRLNAQEVSITIADEGVGIAPDLMQKLGEPFYTTKEKGTGLGLMVSKRIIEQHQGRLHIASVVDQGTTVEVTLPCR
ncbi:PAS domain S-box protein [Tumebacillus sp. ITR2]|uniref:histidine kinase n=1 Tax=Tumebacillus amylolyticus TaxID=2801339 RepID=A0ABS1JFV8_9BACL|nr:PAS domain S-box protein [Tumebacillus amylolyticus]MBL0389167.1 PAS domain S-box protein [Tumebacillus amylolyticus]